MENEKAQVAYGPPSSSLQTQHHRRRSSGISALFNAVTGSLSVNGGAVDVTPSSRGPSPTREAHPPLQHHSRTKSGGGGVSTSHGRVLSRVLFNSADLHNVYDESQTSIPETIIQPNENAVQEAIKNNTHTNLPTTLAYDLVDYFEKIKTDKPYSIPELVNYAKSNGIDKLSARLLETFGEPFVFSTTSISQTSTTPAPAPAPAPVLLSSTAASYSS